MSSEKDREAFQKKKQRLSVQSAQSMLCFFVIYFKGIHVRDQLCHVLKVRSFD